MIMITNQHSILNRFFRGFPIYIPSTLLLLYFNYNNNYLLYIIFGFILIGIIVYFLKNLITYPLHKFIIDYTNNSNYYIPLIGNLNRPANSKNANFFYYGENNYSYSLGMPSGHSMSAGFFCTYLYLYLVNKYDYNNIEKNNLYYVLLLFTIYTMYSRIYIFKVHTIQQTIIGAFLGYIYGIYYYKFSEMIDKKLKIKYN